MAVILSLVEKVVCGTPNLKFSAKLAVGKRTHSWYMSVAVHNTPVSEKVTRKKRLFEIRDKGTFPALKVAQISRIFSPQLLKSDTRKIGIYLDFMSLGPN